MPSWIGTVNNCPFFILGKYQRTSWNILTISMNHYDKIISYIPLDQKLLEVLLIALFGNLSDRKFHVERLDKSDLRRHDKGDLEDDGN